MHSILNGYDTDDLGWPLTPQTTLFVFLVAFHIIVVVNVEISNLVHMLIVASANPLKTNRPEGGMVMVTWFIWIFCSP